MRRPSGGWAFARNCFPVPNAVMTLGLRASALAVYLSLLHHADRESGVCFPSFRTIGAESGLSRNSVAKYVKLLEEEGLIVTEHRETFTKGGMKRNSTLCYTVVPMPLVVAERHARKLAALEQAAQRRKIRERAARLGVVYTPPKDGAGA